MVFAGNEFRIFAVTLEFLLINVQNAESACAKLISRSHEDDLSSR